MTRAHGSTTLPTSHPDHLGLDRSPVDAAVAKAALRARIRAGRRARTPEQRRADAVSLATIVLELAPVQAASCVALYASMLLVTLLYVAVLFAYGSPEWKPIVTAYGGLLLLGGCFISVGMLISSFTRNQIVAGMLTFGVFLLLWVIDWIGSFLGPSGEKIVNYLSITRHFEDFAKGVIDTAHLVYYMSFITFGLFLTAKSVDSERWRG